MTKVFRNRKWQKTVFVMVVFVLGLFWSLPNAWAKYRTNISPSETMDVTLIAGLPTMAAGSNWYKGTTSQSSITEVEFTTKLPTNENIIEQWDASEKQDGSIIAAIVGSKVYISTNGAPKVKTNENSASMFAGWTQLSSIIGTEKLDTSQTTNMGYMFQKCHNLTTLDVSSWDTSKVYNMSYMFHECHSLTQIIGIEKFDTSNVIYCSFMFNECRVLEELDISGWKTSKMTDFRAFLRQNYKLKKLDLTAWDVSSATSTWDMFGECTSLEYIDISTWTTEMISKVIYKPYTFNQVGNTNRKLTIVVGSNEMKMWCQGISSSTYENTMLPSYTVFEVEQEKGPAIIMDGPSWYKGTTSKSNIQTIEFVKSLPTDITYAETWDASSAQDNSVTAAISGTTLYISANGAEKVLANANSSQMFMDFTALKAFNGHELLNMSTAEDTSDMFSFCQSIQNIDLHDWDLSNVLVAQSMFYGCDAMQTANLSNWKFGMVTNLSGMFTDCQQLKTVDTTGWTLSNLQNLSQMFMFSGVSEIIGINDWDVHGCTDMSNMFSYCMNLKSLDISQWDANAVVNASMMFNGCTSLQSLNFPKSGMNSLQNTSSMFANCKLLTELDFTGFTQNVFATNSTDAFKNYGADAQSGVYIWVLYPEVYDALWAHPSMPASVWIGFANDEASIVDTNKTANENTSLSDKPEDRAGEESADDEQINKPSELSSNIHVEDQTGEKGETISDSTSKNSPDSKDEVISGQGIGNKDNSKNSVPTEEVLPAA